MGIEDGNTDTVALYSVDRVNGLESPPVVVVGCNTGKGVPGLFKGQRHKPEARPGRAEEEVREAPGRVLGI